MIDILIATISMDPLKLQRLLNSTKVINDKQLKIDFLIFKNNFNYNEPLFNRDNCAINYFSLNELETKPLEIAEARNFLYQQILNYSSNFKTKPIVWLLDEDIEIDERANSYLPTLNDYKKQNVDVIIGSIEGDSPNAAFSGIRLQLFDLIENIKWLNSLNEDNIFPDREAENNILREKYPDYYYDLSSKHTNHLAEAFWFTPLYEKETVKQAKIRLFASVDSILTGKNMFRPIKHRQINTPVESLHRGGNTFILNLNTLNIDNPVIYLDDSMIRRSDMLWALINKELFNKKIVAMNFSVIHNRENTQENELTVAKTFKENAGSIIFNSFKDFFEIKQTEKYSTLLHSHINSKIEHIQKSHASIIEYVTTLENLKNSKLINLCTQVKSFFSEDNIKNIIDNLNNIYNYSDEIQNQFNNSLPLIKNTCVLKSKYGNFIQYDIGNEDIKMFSRDSIDIMNKESSPLVRIHSSCCNSEVFHALDCDCANQLNKSMRLIQQYGGILFYLNQEGRGHGYNKKIAIVSQMQEKEIDTYSACKQLGLKDDIRSYTQIYSLIEKLGFTNIKLLSNNPLKNLKLRHTVEVIPVRLNAAKHFECLDYANSKQSMAQHANIIINEEILSIYQPCENDIIVFYEKFDKYGEFSNFSNYSYELDNYMWKTSEHYYQAQKFNQNPEIFHKIREAKTPINAKNIAHENRYYYDNSWEKNKIQFMYNAISEKFAQNPELENILLHTNNAYLIEDSPDDEYWGNGLSGEGKNLLGKTLMYLRDELISYRSQDER